MKSNIREMIKILHEISKEESELNIFWMSDEAASKSRNDLIVGRHNIYFRINASFKEPDLEYAFYNPARQKVKRGSIDKTELHELETLYSEIKGFENSTQDPGLSIRDKTIDWCKRNLSEILEITSERQHTRSPAFFKKWRGYNDFFSEKKNDFSQMSDEDIIVALIKNKFCFEDLKFFKSYLAVGMVSLISEEKGNLLAMEKREQISDGAIALAAALRDESVRQGKNNIDDCVHYLAYYPPYYRYVTYVRSLENQLEEHKLLVPKGFPCTEFEAYWSILKNIEDQFKNAANTIFKDRTDNRARYYKRAIDRRLAELRITQSWLKIHQSKQDLAHSKISPSDIFVSIFNAIVSFVVTSKVVKELAEKQKREQNLEDADGGYVGLRKRIKHAIECLLTEYDKINLPQGKESNNELKAFGQKCERILDCLRDDPAESVELALRQIKKNFDEDGELSVDNLAQIRNELSSGMSEEIKEALNKVNLKDIHKITSIDQIASIDQIVSIDKNKEIPNIISLFKMSEPSQNPHKITLDNKSINEPLDQNRILKKHKITLDNKSTNEPSDPYGFFQTTQSNNTNSIGQTPHKITLDNKSTYEPFDPRFFQITQSNNTNSTDQTPHTITLDDKSINEPLDQNRLFKKLSNTPPTRPNSTNSTNSNGHTST